MLHCKGTFYELWTMNYMSVLSQIKLDGCIVSNAHNTVFGRKRSAICAQAVYFLHSTMPIVTCLRLSDLPFYLFTVFNPGLLFFHVSQPSRTAAYLVYPISDIERCQKFE